MHRPVRSAAWLLSAAVLLVAFPLRAASLFDPALRFRVIPTEHFIIHFHQGAEPLAASSRPLPNRPG